MKIISKYKDYYDGVQALGFDARLVFERIESLESFEQPKGYAAYIRDSYEDFELERIAVVAKNSVDGKECFFCEQVTIGFCGKLYAALKMSHESAEKILSTQFFYNSKSCLKFIQDLKRKFRSVNFKGSYSYPVDEPNEKTLDQYFHQSVFDRDYTHWFQDFKTPIFELTVNPHFQRANAYNIKSKNSALIYVIKNPNLKKRNFYKVKDAFTAYQDIAQFMGGVLGNVEDHENNLDDIGKIKQYGFDVKYGFRKRPKKKLK